MITLRQLRYLASLARHRHFGRAAEDCAVTQPALSMQIRELEREIGAELVERRPGEIALTETGLEVAQRAEQILAATRDLVDFARHRDVLSGGAQTRHHSDARALPAAAAAAAAAGEISQLRLEVRETQTSCSSKSYRAANSTAWCWRCRWRRATSRRCRCSTTLPAGGAGRGCAAGGGRVDVDDVDQRRLILLEEGHCLRDQALAFCARQNAASSRDVPAGLGATSLATVMQMVANGYGVTLLPEVAVDAEGRDARVKLLRFKTPEPARSIGSLGGALRRVKKTSKRWERS